MNGNNGRPRAKVLIFGDVALPTGFGRIGAAVGKYLLSKGYQVMGACLQYDGLLPPPLPFFISGLNGRDHGQAMTGIAGWYQPDLILSIQDFPYHAMLRHATGIDWSVTAHVVITPVDGVPIYRPWLDLVDELDGLMTISEFGVRALKEAGKRAVLCPPGVDTDEFYRLPDERRAELRARLGIPAAAFVVGVMAMNQGRKDFPGMVQGFTRAFRDVPEAYLYLDCDKVSEAGWDIPEQLVRQNRLDPARVRYREDALRVGLLPLNERYNLLDLHMVIAKREGYGLPHGEAFATQIPSVAADYCSGREIIGNHERGALIRATPHQYGTWGGAMDYDVDINDLAVRLRALYDLPAGRLARGERAYRWAQARTWENAAQAVERVIQAALEKRAGDIAKKNGGQSLPHPPAPSPQVARGREASPHKSPLHPMERGFRGEVNSLPRPG